MKTNSIKISALYSLGLAALLLAGIWLFPLREHATSQNIAREVNIKAQAAQQHIVQGQFLILVPKIPSGFENILESLGLELTMPILHWALVSKKGHAGGSIIALDSPEAQEDKLILGSLLEHPHILDAQHNYALEAALIPFNKKFSHEWQLHLSTPKNPAAMNMPAAWDITQGTKDITIAVIDEFFTEKGFPFQQRFLTCADHVRVLKPYAHLSGPTALSSIPHGEIMLLALGACGNKEPYSTGINWNAKLLAVERPSLGQAQSFLSALVASGIDVCKQSTLECPSYVPQQSINKANIVLLPFANNAVDLLQFSTDMVDAIRRNNVLVVAATGNNNQDASSFFPGAAPGVINVGALNHQGMRASFSNWGPSIDLLAPGDTIDFYYPSGRKRAQGTSLSAAYVAGALSLMLSLDPELTYPRARYILTHSAFPLSCDKYCAHTPLKPLEGSCKTLCCENNEAQCGMLALDIHQALELTKTKIINEPLLSLPENYILFLRSYLEPHTTTVSNLGDAPAEVEVLVFDENVVVTPMSFHLSERSKDANTQNLQISFKREPFVRTIQKIEMLAKKQGKTVNRAEIYIEYIPKK